MSNGTSTRRKDRGLDVIKRDLGMGDGVSTHAATLRHSISYNCDRFTVCDT
jgi:hypothetical protein